MTTVIILTTADCVENTAWHTGDLIERDGDNETTTVTTEGGVRLRLVAPLGGAR